MAETEIHKRVEAARADCNAHVITRMSSGWAVMGDHQIVHGYTLLLPDPVVPDLNALLGDDRAQFLHDMTVLGDAVLEITGCARVNYEILGNLEPALHAHVFPRYTDEPDSHRTKPIWFYDLANAQPFDPENPEHEELRRQIKQVIDKRI